MPLELSTVNGGVRDEECEWREDKKRTRMKEGKKKKLLTDKVSGGAKKVIKF